MSERNLKCPYGLLGNWLQSCLLDRPLSWPFLAEFGSRPSRTKSIDSVQTGRSLDPDFEVLWGVVNLAKCWYGFFQLSEAEAKSLAWLTPQPHSLFQTVDLMDWWSSPQKTIHHKLTFLYLSSLLTLSRQNPKLEFFKPASVFLFLFHGRTKFFSNWILLQIFLR